MTNEHSTILVIDDEPANLKLLFDYLQQAGFKVLVAPDAQAAFESISHLLPDLILLDIRLPDIDGFEVCRRLKADPATRDIPVLFITVMTDLAEKVKGFELGAADYITKPIWVEEVAARVRTHLNLRNLQKQFEADIAARKQAEEALRASKERYRSLFENMTEGFALHEIICDSSGKPVDYRFMQVNPAFERLTGLARADLIGKTVRAVLPGTEDFWIERYGQVALTGEATHFEEYASVLRQHYEVLAYRPAPGQFAVLFIDITARKQADEEREKLIVELQKALSEVKTLKGIVPICASCKRIRDDKGYWERIEVYIRDRSDAEFSHGICPECLRELYPDFVDDKK